jgi:regulator of replication initiation timing
MLGFTALVQAQTFQNAGDYLNYMNNQQMEILKASMSYTSAINHNKSARKVENRRKELLQTIATAKQKVKAMEPYKGDKALRDSLAKYYELTYHVYNDDYGKIIDLEEVSEQSYDKMEAYFKAQELADEKLDEANKFVGDQYKVFAEKNKIRLVESSDDFTKKIEATSKVNKYHREVFLIMFKSSNQENYLIEAMNNKDINALEQSKNNLVKYADEGLKKLTALKPHAGDYSLSNSCKQLLMFYQTECKTFVPLKMDYLVKEDNFAKLKKAFDLKSDSERTKQDIDTYNKAVNELNAAVNKSNTINKANNEKRKTLLDNWNSTSKSFLDKHTPKY